MFDVICLDLLVCESRSNELSDCIRSVSFDAGGSLVRSFASWALWSGLSFNAVQELDLIMFSVGGPLYCRRGNFLVERPCTPVICRSSLALCTASAPTGTTNALREASLRLREELPLFSEEMSLPPKHSSELRGVSSNGASSGRPDD